MSSRHRSDARPSTVGERFCRCRCSIGKSCVVASDLYGHGSLMAGLALYGDLGEFLASQTPEALLHRGESVKVLNQDGDNAGALYGDICREAIARAEVTAPERVRSICLAVTAKEDMDRGKPSSWSATLDALAAGSEDENRRLILVSAGTPIPPTTISIQTQMSRIRFTTPLKLGT